MYWSEIRLLATNFAHLQHISFLFIYGFHRDFTEGITELGTIFLWATPSTWLCDNPYLVNFKVIPLKKERTFSEIFGQCVTQFEKAQ